MVLYSLASSFCKYFEFYKDWFKYLPDILGYSLFSNLALYLLFFNKKYCTTTKIAVISLFAINLISIASSLF